MEYGPELAEVCGIHAGDGYLRNKNYNRELDVSGSFEEQAYYDEYVIPLFSKVFGIKVQGRVFESRRTYGFIMRGKEVVEKMHELGFPYGAKSSIVKAPKFVMDAKDAAVKNAFLRGLFDTDGCLSYEKKSGSYREFKRTHNYYPIIHIKTISKFLFRDLKNLLTDVGIHYWADTYMYKNKNWMNANRVWIRGTTVEHWMRTIGTKNPIKLSKYIIWKRYGHCPPRTTFAERLSILSGDITIDEGPVR